MIFILLSIYVNLQNKKSCSVNYFILIYKRVYRNNFIILRKVWAHLPCTWGAAYVGVKCVVVASVGVTCVEVASVGVTCVVVASMGVTCVVSGLHHYSVGGLAR